jgi:hypothetical protein
MIHHAKKWLQQNVFHPIAIIWEMDLAGGTLNYEGVKIICHVETGS